MTKFPKTLRLMGWRYLLRHPWQSILMVLGIMLGVAVVVSIDIANASASRAFDLSVDSIAGRTTHQIVGPPHGIDESVYVDLLLADGELIGTPIMSEYITSPDLGDRSLHLLGVDPFSEAPFRDYLAGGGDGVPLDQLTRFLTQPGAILLSADLAGQYGLSDGNTITLIVGGQEKSAVVAGILAPTDDLSRRALQGLLLADIATVQELTGRIGRVDRVDLIMSDEQARTIDDSLPPGVHVVEASARAGTVEQMTDAFKTNLLALSLLALVVGMFLIYNTITFSVVQRRVLFGTLRSLGVTRREVFWLVLSEAFIVGLIGSSLGGGLGIILGRGAIQLVTRTINDLFFVLTVQGTSLPPESLIKGLILGIGATVLTAAPPAWEAASVPPRTALSRSGLESKAVGAVNGVAIAGIILMVVGAVGLLIPADGLLLSFAGTFFVIIGCAMLTPVVMRWFMQQVTPVTARIWGALGRMAPRDVVSSLSRTSIAVASLMVAVSVTIGISLMVGSFRHTVIIWLEQTLQGDVYISVPGGTQVSANTAVDPAAVASLPDWPGVESVATIRSVGVESSVGPVNLVAADDPAGASERQYLTVDGSPEQVWRRVQDGEAVIVSEPFARLHDIPRHGGSVTLYTPQGEVSFPVAGIYYDYGSVQGTVIIDQQTYREYYDDQAVTAVALQLEPGVDPDQLAADLTAALADIQDVQAIANKALRDEVLVIFDQTFAITGALNVLATIVAFIGVLSSLLALQLEKGRQIGILRSIGLTVRQMWGMVMLETGLMGAVAGLMAMPTGFILSLILIYIINRRSFGWTLQMQVTPEPFFEALLIAVLAALLAGIYPARKMSRTITANAIRFE